MSRQPSILSFLTKGPTTQKKNSKSARVIESSDDEISLKKQKNIDTHHLKDLSTNSQKINSPLNHTDSPINKKLLHQKPQKLKDTKPLNNEKIVKDDPTPSKNYSGTSVPYLDLCEIFAKIEETTKRYLGLSNIRLQIAAFLTSFFSYVIKTAPNSLLECVYLCLNRVGPEYVCASLIV
jgi:DNA ligase-1